jgi:hypothetical protein
MSDFLYDVIKVIKNKNRADTASDIKDGMLAYSKVDGGGVWRETDAVHHFLPDEDTVDAKIATAVGSITRLEFDANNYIEIQGTRVDVVVNGSTILTAQTGSGSSQLANFLGDVYAKMDATSAKLTTTNHNITVDKTTGATSTNDQTIYDADATGNSIVTKGVLVNEFGTPDYTDYNPQSSDPAYLEGRSWYDALEKKNKFFNDNPNFIQWVNGALTLRATNETGSLITAGKAVDVHDINTAGTGFLIHLADSLEIANSNDEGWVIAIATEDIAHNGTGQIAIFGTLTGVPAATASLTFGKAAYVGTNGDLTGVRPNYPAKSILVGSAIASGVIGIKIESDSYDYEFDGTILEKHQYQIVEGTGVDANDVVGQLYCDVWNLDNPTRDLPVQLGGSIYPLNTTSGTSPSGYARIQLTQGTDTLAQFNRVYVKINAGAAELAVTSGYPPQPFAVVGRMSIWTAAKFATDGPKNNRRTTSAKQYDSMGIIKTILERLGVLPPWVESNVTPTASLAANVMNVDMPEADIYQTFKQTFPNMEVITDGIYVANGAGGVSLGNNTKVTDIKSLAGYTNVDEARNTSCTGTLFIFASVNKEQTECKLFANLPNRLSGTNSAGGRRAYFDTDGDTNYSGTADGGYTEFSVGRLAYHYNGGNINFLDSDGNSTATSDSFFPLINNPMGTSGGGGGASGALQNLLQVLQQGNSAGSLQIKDAADGTDAQDLTTVAQSVLLSGDQTIAGVKSFTGDVVVGNTTATTSNTFEVYLKLTRLNINQAGSQAILLGGTTLDTNDRAHLSYDGSTSKLRFDTANTGQKMVFGSYNGGTELDFMTLNSDGSATIHGDTINIATQKTPSSATDTGTKGDIVHDSNYIYVCTATNTWKRVAIATW